MPEHLYRMVLGADMTLEKIKQLFKDVLVNIDNL